MGHFSKTELNPTHFDTNLNCLLVLWKGLVDFFQKQLEVLKKVLYGEVVRERNVWPLMTQYIFTWWNRQMCVNMTSSKVVCTRHHIRMFLRRSLVMKINPNTGQTPGTMAKGNKKDMAKSEGRVLLTVETLKTFYCCIDNRWWRKNRTHFVTNNLEKQ